MPDNNPYAPPTAHISDNAAEITVWDRKESLASKCLRDTNKGVYATMLPLIGILLCVFLPISFLEAFIDFNFIPDEEFVGSLLLTTLFSQFLFIIPAAAVMCLAWHYLHAESCSLGAALLAALKRYFPLCWTCFLMGLSVFAYLLFIIPGVYVSTRWFLAEVAVMTEKVSGSSAIKRSWELSGDTFWDIFRAMLLCLLVWLLLALPALLAWSFLPWDTWLIDGILETSTCLVTIYFYFFTTVMFFHLSRSPDEAVEQ